MKVEELMVREVMSCSPDDMLNRAAQIMWENDCGCVPVVDSAARVLGMLTDRDICMAAYTRGQTLNHIPVSAAMSSEVFACRAGDDLLDAQKVMRKHQVRRLPVNDSKGRLVGLLSLSDLARAIPRKAVTKTTAADTLVRVCAPHPRPQSSEPPTTARPSVRLRTRKP
jgi:CBS-domain-containing membrane protein